MRVHHMAGVVALIALFGVTPSAAQVCVDGWSWRVPITIDNTANPNPFTNLEVAVTVDTAAPIAAGLMQASGADIRFTDGSSCLCHTLESGLNTASTAIWVRVPTVPAAATTTIWMYYGNPAAASDDDPYCTFAFFEGFEDASLAFTNPCGSLTTNVAGGIGTLSWPSSGLLVSNVALPQAAVYIGEAQVTGASGTWPGLYWALDDASQRSYSVLIDPTQVRIGVSGAGSGWCQGQNWASALTPYSSPVGLWQLTWAATGDIRATFPSVGAITSTDTVLTRNADLRLMLGGISSGTGSLSVDWARARQLASPAPSATPGAQEQAQFEADLSIIKTVTPAFVTTGDVVTYTITAANAGPDSALGVTLTDAFPPSLGSVTWTCVGTGGGTCTAAGVGSIADTIDLPPGGSVTYTAQATVTSNVSGQIVNTAVVTPPANTIDPTPGDESASASVVLDAALAIPTLGGHGLALLIVALVIAGLALARRIA